MVGNSLWLADSEMDTGSMMMSGLVPDLLIS